VKDPQFVVINTTLGQVAGGTTIAPPAAKAFAAAQIREEMARAYPTLNVMVTQVQLPKAESVTESAMPMMEL
jgi:hypothetical protein